MPTFVVVKCVSAFAMLAVCAGLLLGAVETGRIEYAAGGVVAGLGTLGVLAAISLRVVYCIQPQEESARRRAKRRAFHRVPGSV